MLLRAPPTSGEATGPVISQSTAIVLIVMIVGISLYLWRTGYLRSRAALIAVAAILLALIYFVITANPVLS